MNTKPSAKKIKNAIDQCGYERIRRNDGYYYKDIKMNEGLRTMLDNFLIQKQMVNAQEMELIMLES